MRPLQIFRWTILATPFLFCVSLSALAESTLGRAGQIAYAAWDCAALGSIAELDPAEVERLFHLGYENARLFVEAANSGKLDQEDTSDLPIGLTLKLGGGPTSEFQVGALWARISRAAYDDHWKQIDGASFEEMKELQMMSASTAFRRANCELLK